MLLVRRVSKGFAPKGGKGMAHIFASRPKLDPEQATAGLYKQCRGQAGY